MECALKALIKKYQPKIVVLEAITNHEGKFAAAAQLGKRLTRLLDNKKNCILGITKYSKDPHYIKIDEIEEQQKKDRLIPMEKEETELTGQIRLLSAPNMASLPGVQEMIPQLQEKLARVQQKITEELQQPLSDTDQKKHCRKHVKDDEEELLKQIGLGSIIRFSDLKDTHRLTCLETLSNLPESECIRICSKQLLDQEDEKLLEERFKNNLAKKMETKNDYDTEFKDYKTFEQSVLETSLINAVFSESNPEIGQFLHLPEIDPTLVRKYDKEIVDNFIKNYRGSIIGTLNISLINRIISSLGAKANKDKVVKLKRKMDQVRDYVLGLLGELPKDKAQADIKWADIQIQHKAKTDAIKEKFELPTWAHFLIGTSLVLPIRALLTWNAHNEAIQIAIEETIDTSCLELDQMFEILQRLNDIKKIIEKQEALDVAFNSVPISLETFETLNASIQARINKVRAAYGADDWDNRISFLADQLILINFEPQNIAHVMCVSAFSYWFIEQDVFRLAHNSSHKGRLDNVGDESNLVWMDDELKKLLLTDTKPDFDQFIIITKAVFSDSNMFRLKIKNLNKCNIFIVGKGYFPEIKTEIKFIQDIIENAKIFTLNSPLTVHYPQQHS